MNKFLILAILMIAAEAFPSPVLQSSSGARVSELSSRKAAPHCQEAKDKRDTYLEIWKAQFSRRNTLDQSLFDTHISVVDYDIECAWVSGISFRVRYKVTYDWAVVEHQDQFVVLLHNKEEAYSHLPIKRDRLFDEEEVAYAIDKHIFFSSVAPVKVVGKLAFESYEEALKAFQKQLGGEKIENARISLFVPGKGEDGYPYLLGRGVVDASKNVCVNGYMNLVTGRAEARRDACVVNE